MHLAEAMRAGHWHWHFAGHRAGDSFHEATDPQGPGQRLIIKKAARRRWLKAELNMIKLKIQFVGETRFDQPIWCVTRTRVQWPPGIRISSRTAAIAGRPKPIKPELTCGIWAATLACSQLFLRQQTHAQSEPYQARNIVHIQAIH